MSIRVLLRVDAYPAIGTGHLMRCLALALQLRALGAQVAFVARIEPERLRENILHAEFEVLPVPAHLPSVLGGTDWVVLDGYAFGLDEQCAIKATGVRLMVIDDLAAQDEYCADLVLNQNASPGTLAYPGAKQVLLGPGYAMLRPEFLSASRGTGYAGGAYRILVTLGGGAPPRSAEVLFSAVKELRYPVQVRALGVTPQAPIEREGLTMELLPYADDMPVQMAWADLALCAGGSTCWELAYMGVPALITVLSADQTRVAEQMELAGCALNFGWHHDIGTEAVLAGLNKLLANPDLANSMRERGSSLVDGQGAERVARIILEIEG